MRIYDPRVGRFLSVDPLTKQYAHYTPYSYAGNKPITFIDRDGEEEGFEYALDRQQNGLVFNGKNMVRMTPEQIQEGQRARGMGALLGTAIVVDVFLTKGKISQTLLYSELFSAFPHNQAKTAERRAEQNKESWNHLINAGLMWGSGKVVGAVFQTFGEGLDIALGKNINLKSFAEKTSSSSFHTWETLPGYTDAAQNFNSFEDAFKYATETAKSTGGKIKFNLEYVNLKAVGQIKPGTGLYEHLEALGGKSLWESNMTTEWEMSQIMNNKDLLKITEFQKMGKAVPASSVKAATTGN